VEAMRVRFSVLSGDPRNARLYEILTEEGRDARLFSQDKAAEAAVYGDVIVLPVKGVSGELFNGLLQDGQSLITGEDFLSREDFLILNALTTSEGALELAMREMPITLHGSKVLVTGFGRIGKLLCKSLAALGAVVTASARNDAGFSWIEAHGYNAAHTMKLDGTLSCYDAVFNTVPHLILTSSRLRELKSSCIIIDLASAPGGTDFKTAERLGLCCRWALSLPGKSSPESAARHMRLVLDRILAERGISV
jgi:dipicolinate synthase subunit A